MNSQVWWFVARSSGIVAWALLTFSVCWGLLLSTRLLARRVSPSWLLDLHRHLGGLAVVFTGVHLVGLVADSYVTFGWAELFIPMASSWKPGAVAFGIVAFYLLVAIEITSLAMRRLPRSVWRWVHRSSFVLFGVATYHGIVAGTDAGNAWYRVATWVSIGVVVALTLVLLIVARRMRTPLASFPPGVVRAGDEDGRCDSPSVARPAQVAPRPLVSVPPPPPPSVPMSIPTPLAPADSGLPTPALPTPVVPSPPRRPDVAVPGSPPQPGVAGPRPAEQPRVEQPTSPWLPPSGESAVPGQARDLITAGRNGADAGEPPTTAT